MVSGFCCKFRCLVFGGRDGGEGFGVGAMSVDAV